MEDTSFPAKGEKCVQPVSCWQRHQRIKQQFDRSQFVIDQELQRFLLDEDWKDKVHPSKHALKRMLERSINRIEVLELIETGYSIACEGGYPTRALMSRIKVGRGMYRTVHLLYRFVKGTMMIVTLYEPKHSAYLYDSALEYRICWCASHPDDFS